MARIVSGRTTRTPIGSRVPRSASHGLDLGRERAFALGRGRRDPAITSSLRAAEHGKHLLLLEGVRREARDLPRSPGIEAFRRGHELFTEAERRAPHVVADVVTLPQVGGWTAQCLSASPAELAGEDGPARLGYLCALAASAALRASLEFEIAVPAGDGFISLPGLGRLSAPGVGSGEWIRLRSDVPGKLVADHKGMALSARPLDHAPQRDWAPLPRLRATAGDLTLDVVIDTDEHLAFQFGRVTDDFAEAALGRWSALIDDAWRILSERHHDVAEGMVSVVRTLVPLPRDGGRGPRSATSGWLWGAIALGLPRDAWDLAEILVHEYHHLLLGALEDNAPLVGPNAQGWHYAPWRDDPRPLAGLLHGTYANLAMAEFWLVESGRQENRTESPNAEVEFAWRRNATRGAIGDLEAADGLTHAGSAFLDGLKIRWEDLGKSVVSPSSRRTALELTLEHRLRWRLAHLRPDESSIEQLVTAWSAERSPSRRLRWPDVRVVSQSPFDSDLHRILRSRDASHSSAVLGPAELALLRGDDQRAYEMCLTDIAQGGGHSPWITLALSILRLDQAATDSPLLTRPEVVSALYERLRDAGDAPPSPADLLSWLSEIIDESA